MKYHLILTLALGLALPTIALAKEKGTNATAGEATFKKIEQEILDGILKSDTSAAEKYLTSDYLGVGPDGVTQNKAEFLSDIKSGTLKIESSKYSDMKVRPPTPIWLWSCIAAMIRAPIKARTSRASIGGSMSS
jgi:Domain of unknown function (DUF4440)